MLFNIHIQDYIEEYYNRKGKIDWTVAAAKDLKIFKSCSENKHIYEVALPSL